MAFLDETGLAELWKITNEWGLTDETKNSFGLTATATPNDVFALLKKHFWLRLAEGNFYSVVQISKYGTLFRYNNGGTTVTYGNSYTLNGDGSISIDNPTTTTITAYSQASVLAGKYYKQSGDGNNTVRYIDSGAKFTNSSSDDDGNRYVMISNNGTYNGYEYKSVYNQPTDGWALVSHSDRNAYPDDGSQDGFLYKYRGVPFDNALSVKMASGSFNGTGGSITLHFEFNPRIVIIQTNGNGTYGAATFIAMRGNTNGLVKSTYSSALYGYATKTTVTWGDKSMTTTAGASLSATGVAHQYIAIG